MPDSEYVGKIISCPTNIASSGSIKIVGDQSNCIANSQQFKCNWELLAVEWDKNRDRYVGQPFAIKKVEVDQWMLCS